MSEDDEWGPWIDWEGGKPCPVKPGVYLGALQRFRSGDERYAEGWSHKTRDEAWMQTTSDGHFCMVLRYRIREPRGMKALAGLLEKAPELVE